MHESGTMPIKSHWGDETHTCIIVSCVSEWSWDELHAHEQTTLVNMLTSASQAVNLLLDLKHGVWVKPDSLQAEVEESGRFHSAYGIPAVVFIVGDAAIGTLLLHLYQRHGSSNSGYYHAQSIERARAILKC